MDKPTITRREWRNVILFAVAVMALTTLPYVVGALSQRPDLRFGWFMFGVVDGNSYLAKMREGAVGGWLFHIVYTSEPHDGAFLFAPYLAGGKLATLFASPSDPAFVDAMILVFQVSRLVFGFVLILVTYRFIAAFLVKRSLRWLAIWLICLGGGFGWLLILLGQSNLLGSLPIDLILPEGYTFFVLYGLPHVALARAALLGGLLLTMHALRLPSPRQWIPFSVLAGLCWLIMGLCVPFYIGVIYAILGVWGLAALIRQRAFPMPLFVRCVIGALIPAPYLLYNLYVFATNPILGAWSSQNILTSPNPLHYVLGYGLLALLALPAIRWAWHRGRHVTAYLLPAAWIIAAPVLAYLPINVQRRLLEAVFVPLVILAVMGLRLLWIGSGVRRLPRRARLIWREAVVGLIVLLLPTTLIILSGGITATRSDDPSLFHTSGEIAALDWLNAHAPPDSIALSTFEVGNYLPVRTSLRVYVGHSPETIRFGEKSALVDRFFAGQMSDDELQAFLQDNLIQYVIVPPGKTLPPNANLTQVYASDGYFIYQNVLMA